MIYCKRGMSFALPIFTRSATFLWTLAVAGTFIIGGQPAYITPLSMVCSSRSYA
jgi:hypothetical protein